MRPEVTTSTGKSLMTLFMEVMPELAENEYMAANVSMIALMSQFSAQEYERGADIRMAENKGVRALLREGTEVTGKADYAAAADAAEPASLKISDLNAANEPAMRALIQLHEQAESENPALAAKITRFLAENANRRAIDGMILAMLGEMAG